MRKKPAMSTAERKKHLYLIVSLFSFSSILSKHLTKVGVNILPQNKNILILIIILLQCNKGSICFIYLIKSGSYGRHFFLIAHKL